jgi:hypothetical protein
VTEALRRTGLPVRRHRDQRDHLVALGGNHAVAASYSGDTNFNGSSSDSNTSVVRFSNPASFVNLSAASVTYGNWVANPDSAIEEYAAGNSGLQYQGNGNWQFNWKTPREYA